MPLEEKNVQYKTWIKRTLVEGLRRVFSAHVDEVLRDTKVTIEYPTDKASYPAIIVRFFERSLTNAGIDHREYIEINGFDYLFKHYFYNGDIEFAIHALSSLDRDLIADSLVQTLSMGDLTEYTDEFMDRVQADEQEHPAAEYNYIDLNTDNLAGFGETQAPAPWGPEDVLVYQTSYRCGVRGEFYSLPPDVDDVVGYIEEVDQYPYMTDIEDIPDGADDEAEWKPPLQD